MKAMRQYSAETNSNRINGVTADCAATYSITVKRFTSEFTVNELLFYVAWILFASSLILNSGIFYVYNDALELLFKIMRYLAYLICIVKICRQLVKNVYIPILIVVFCVFVFGGVSSRDMTYPLYGFVVLASFGVSADRTIRLTAFLQAMYLFLIVFLSQSGILLDYVFDPGERGRHGLGFSWATTGPILFFYLCLCLLYVFRDRVRIRWLLILELINLWLFYMTDSKMAFLLLTVTLLFFAVQSVNRRRWTWLSRLKLLYIAFPFLMFGISLLSARFYNENSSNWTAINKLLSYRLSLAQNAYQTYGIRLTGQTIKWVGYDYKALFEPQGVYNYVDNSYLRIALNNGLVFLIVVLAIYSFGIYRAIRKNEYSLVFIYMIILLFSCTEPRLMNFAYNPFPLLALGEIPENTVFRRRGLSMRRAGCKL